MTISSSGRELAETQRKVLPKWRGVALMIFEVLEMGTSSPLNFSVCAAATLREVTRHVCPSNAFAGHAIPCLAGCRVPRYSVSIATILFLMYSPMPANGTGAGVAVGAGVDVGIGVG